ncbi:MAG TPA: hypothetical protein DEO57_03340, partial [Phycisphaerales bacterium]|nr:hypothetical protein [Phycisphaerales bacterium]
MDAQLVQSVATIDTAITEPGRVQTVPGIIGRMVAESLPGHGHPIPTAGVGTEHHTAGPAEQFRPPVLDGTGPPGIVHEQRDPVTGPEL